jgi:hypothetical protein
MAVDALSVFAEHMYRSDDGIRLDRGIETGQFIIQQYPYDRVIMVGLCVNAHRAVLLDRGGDFYAERDRDYLSIRKLDCYVSHHDSTPQSSSDSCIIGSVADFFEKPQLKTFEAQENLVPHSRLLVYSLLKFR